MPGGEKKGRCDEKRLEGSAETRSPESGSQALGAWILSSEQWKAAKVTKQGCSATSEKCVC